LAAADRKSQGAITRIIHVLPIVLQVSHQFVTSSAGRPRFQRAGVSTRTAYRRLREVDFRAKVKSCVPRLLGVSLLLFLALLVDNEPVMNHGESEQVLHGPLVWRHTWQGLRIPSTGQRARTT